ncbi:MAG: hypothetical protein AAEJ43_13550 [Gammaproteobacteria bacterium]
MSTGGEKVRNKGSAILLGVIIHRMDRLECLDVSLRGPAHRMWQGRHSRRGDGRHVERLVVSVL